MLKIENTGRTMKQNVDPTSDDVNYMYDGSPMRIKKGYYWLNTVSGDLFMVIDNDGVTASWVKFTTTAV